MFGTCLKLQLQAIAVFISASTRLVHIVSFLKLIIREIFFPVNIHVHNVHVHRAK